MPGIAFLHSLKHAFGLEDAHTQTSALERDALVRHCQGRRRAAEIGVYEGVTTGLLAQQLQVQGGHLFAIDPFFPGRLGICWSESVAKREVRNSKAGDCVTFVKELSHKAGAMLEGEFDFVFVDGDHSLSGIEQDWTVWSAKIPKGGIVALHDTQVPAHNSGVADLGSYQYFHQVIAFDQRFETVEVVDSLTVLRRR